MSNGQWILFLRDENGEPKWFKIGYEKIWIHLLWKLITDGKYVGQIENGEPNGQGTFTFSDGRKYEGEWENGDRHGQGTFTSPEGDKYEGDFKEGKRHGQGTYTYPDGEKYVGEFKDGKENGQGTYTWSNGEKYIGEYKDGKPWNGTEYDKNGRIIGKFVNGVRQ